MKPKDNVAFDHSNLFYILSFSATISADSETNPSTSSLPYHNVQSYVLLFTLKPYLPSKLGIAPWLQWLKHTFLPISGKRSLGSGFFPLQTRQRRDQRRWTGRGKVLPGTAQLPRG